jgi:hypothetical protein
MMAYCRFGDDSDVYLGVAWVCHRCRLAPLEDVAVAVTGGKGTFKIHKDRTFKTPVEAFRHLQEHESAGHKVPKRAFTRLIEDIVGDDDMVPRSENAVDR